MQLPMPSVMLSPAQTTLLIVPDRAVRMLPRMTGAAGLALALGTGLLVSCLAGCASSGSGGASSARPAQGAASETYVELFAGGQYNAAFDAAVEAAGKERPPRQDQARLIAGLSAHALNRNAEAVRWLAPLERNGDPGISGRALATLGLIAQEREEHESAAGLLTRASQKLREDESARASMYAGDSLRMLGRRSDADAMYASAAERVVSDQSLRLMIGDRQRGVFPVAGTRAAMGPGAASQVLGAPAGSTAASGSRSRELTVQVGAFGNRRTAEREAQKLSQRGITSRIVPILDAKNNRLFAVRVGQFTNREAAQRIRDQVGGKAVITVASGE